MVTFYTETNNIHSRIFKAWHYVSKSKNNYKLHVNFLKKKSNSILYFEQYENDPFDIYQYSNVLKY